MWDVRKSTCQTSGLVRHISNCRYLHPIWMHVYSLFILTPEARKRKASVATGTKFNSRHLTPFCVDTALNAKRTPSRWNQISAWSLRLLSLSFVASRGGRFRYWAQYFSNLVLQKVKFCTEYKIQQFLKSTVIQTSKVGWELAFFWYFEPLKGFSKHFEGLLKI